MRKLITFGAACALIAAAGFAAATIMSGAGIASIFQTTGTTGTTGTVVTQTVTTGTTTTVVTPPPPAPPPRRVTICHRTKSKITPWVTVTVAQGAVAAHRRHGDHLGRCTGNERVTVCHKNKAKNAAKRWSRLVIRQKALRTHKRHGDTVGLCSAKQLKQNKGKGKRK